MATYTTNYNLTKIDLNDAPPDITVLNQNWDAIDEELGNINEELGNIGETVEQALDNLTPEKIGAQPAATAINTSNIGSQSVEYANNAGDADTVDGWHVNTDPLQWGLKPIVATDLDLQANASLTTGYIYLVYE